MKKRLKGIPAALFFLCAGMLHADVDLEGQLTREYAIEAGDVITGNIVLRNSGIEAEEVKLYQTDYASSSDGSHYYLDPNTTPRSNASWITISPKRFIIAAGDSYTAHYTLTAPKDKTLNGTYWSILMVEPIPKGSAESSSFDPEKTTLGINTVLRYAVRMITHFGNGKTVPPEIQKASVVTEENKRVLQVDVSNPGTKLLRITLWAELYTEEGEFVGTYPGEKLALFPSSSIRFSVDLSNAPKNRYLALVVMDCGNNDVFGANFPLAFQ